MFSPLAHSTQIHTTSRPEPSDMQLPGQQTPAITVTHGVEGVSFALNDDYDCV